mmetsp:Transcript_13622/g.24331  ORF Transcript_13622/g.24331 Transcript_13622/m.24331 type:complete len:209 (+) Transcript_13622:869-1495(+)
MCVCVPARSICRGAWSCSQSTCPSATTVSAGLTGDISGDWSTCWACPSAAVGSQVTVSARCSQSVVSPRAERMGELTGDMAKGVSGSAGWPAALSPLAGGAAGSPNFRGEGFSFCIDSACNCRGCTFPVPRRPGSGPRAVGRQVPRPVGGLRRPSDRSKCCGPPCWLSGDACGTASVAAERPECGPRLADLVSRDPEGPGRRAGTASA